MLWPGEITKRYVNSPGQATNGQFQTFEYGRGGDMPEEMPAIIPGETGRCLTAFSEDEATLRRRMSGGRVDSASFRRRLSRCQISTCRGMCCYDGVYVSPEAAAAIERVAEEHAGFFAGLGLRLPAQVIVEGDWAWRRGGLKTAVTGRPFSATVEGFPSHFTDTACVFLAGDGRCSLQLLSVSLGRHPWYYKPPKCWQHPMTLEGDAQAVLLLHNERTDPFRFPGYDGFVSRIFCGRTDPEGAPAAVVLAEELRFLSRIVGRDLWLDAQGTGDCVTGSEQPV